MKDLLLSAMFLLLGFYVSAQKTDDVLQKKVEQLTGGFNGTLGVFIKSLKTGKSVSINADTLFPTASVVKVPILIGIMDRIEKKELDYHQKVTWYDTLNYDPGEDIVACLKPQTNIELSKVMMLMMTTSDNNASLWLQAIAGGGLAINRLMDENGYVHTKVNSRTPGREAIRAVFGWGNSTPKEMARIYEDIAARKLISKTASEKMLRIMGRQYWDEEGLSALPPDVFAASKTGAVNASRNEVMFVNARHPYIFSVFTKNNKDISWEADNEAWVLTRALSKLVWEHFNGKTK